MSHSADSTKDGIVVILDSESFRSAISDSLGEAAANAGWSGRMVAERDTAAMVERNVRRDESDDSLGVGVSCRIV